MFSSMGVTFFLFYQSFKNSSCSLQVATDTNPTSDHLYRNILWYMDGAKNLDKWTE